MPTFRALRDWIWWMLQTRAQARHRLRAAERLALAPPMRLGVRDLATVPPSSECPIPIPGCQTCGTSLPAWVGLPAVAADYSGHSWPAAFGVDAVAHWMIAVYPDAWYREQPTYIWAVAERLKAVRSRVLFGRVAL